MWCHHPAGSFACCVGFRYFHSLLLVVHLHTPVGTVHSGLWIAVGCKLGRMMVRLVMVTRGQPQCKWSVYLVSGNIFLGLHRMELCRIWNPEIVPSKKECHLPTIYCTYTWGRWSTDQQFHQEWKFPKKSKMSLPKVPSWTWRNSCMLEDSRGVDALQFICDKIYSWTMRKEDTKKFYSSTNNIQQPWLFFFKD